MTHPTRSQAVTNASIPSATSTARSGRGATRYRELGIPSAHQYVRQALLPDAVRNNATIYPGAEIFARGEWPGTLPSETQKLRDRIWTEIKSA